jgi:cyclophilin family peptidyl-prolyl cis-trans isomerase
MKKLAMLLIALTLTGCFSKDSGPASTQADGAEGITAADLKTSDNGLSEAKIVIKLAQGNIAFKLYPKQAPNTVTRIIELTQKGFFDGLVFHRVVPNFVVQTGDPTGTGMGGSGKNLKAEFNSIQHIKGTVAMARAQDKDSADSQFYIALTTTPHLDGSYTVFGQVIEGLEFLDKIAQGDKIISMTFQP